MSITDEQREWRALMVDAIEETRAAIKEINGGYRPTLQALGALEELAGVAIDDEVLGRCEHCSEPIWAIADGKTGKYASTDGGYLCEGCVLLAAVTDDLPDEDGDLETEGTDTPTEQENPA